MVESMPAHKPDGQGFKVDALWLMATSSGVTTAAALWWGPEVDHPTTCRLLRQLAPAALQGPTTWWLQSVQTPHTTRPAHTWCGIPSAWFPVFTLMHKANALTHIYMVGWHVHRHQPHVPFMCLHRHAAHTHIHAIRQRHPQHPVSTLLLPWCRCFTR